MKGLIHIAILGEATDKGNTSNEPVMDVWSLTHGTKSFILNSRFSNASCSELEISDVHLAASKYYQVQSSSRHPLNTIHVGLP